MAFQSRARKLPSLLDGKLQEFWNASRRKEKGRDQAGSLKLAAYSISKWPIGAPAVISSVCRCSRNQIQRAVAFLINFLFRKHENSPLGKVHSAFRLLPVVPFPPPRAVPVKKNARNSLGWGESRTMPEKQMREDQSAPRAHRTDYFYDVTSPTRGCPRDEIPPSRSSCNESSPRKRAVQPSSATDNDLPPRDRNTSRCLLFRVVLTLLLTTTTRQINGRGHRKEKRVRKEG